uniref:Isopentenyl-diphosphate delta-isomerase 2 n=1 Tax=Jaculus jaculus TaxID=51337 RepID=A0A8C5K7Y5_JACJA
MSQVMEEMCIIIDKQDWVIGGETKGRCCLMENIEKGEYLPGYILNKLNYPNTQYKNTHIFSGHFTDSCSSNPLYNPEELEENNAIGMRRMALRHLQAELGIPRNRYTIFIQDIIFVSQKYHKYQEHEVGSLLFVRRDHTVNPDPTEIKGHCFMSLEELVELLDRQPVTPWFRTIVEDFLFHWLSYLEDTSPFMEPNKIYGL